MKTVKPLSEIFVPEPPPEKVYTLEVMDQTFSFRGLKQLLGAADVSKAGDRNNGLGAENDIAREVARRILSSLTLQELYDTPLTSSSGKVDSVMRAGYEIDTDYFKSISGKTLGELKNEMLSLGGKELKQIGRALTSVSIAALAKIMDVHELIFISKQISHPTRARTLIGVPGTLSFRLQPNHPTDDLDAISLLIYTDLSMGMGDCLIGVNPSVGTVENIGSVLRHIDRLRRKTGAPSQICVLGHVKQQLECLKLGVPVEILFQSLAGTESTLTEEFDVTVEFLDEAYETMAKNGPLAGIADQFMYFETGQGSEVTYKKHDGMDMTTCEALCYGLCRRYDPFMVNSATGFIGPETHLNDFEVMMANLQDHFMGKLHGLPMGVSPSYTLHSNCHLEGQQMATQLLTAAGSNFFMDVYLGTDRMLAHFVNSGHDNQTLREVHGRKPAPEFLNWAVEKGIYEQSPDGTVRRGPNWGNPGIFCSSESEFQRLRDLLPTAPGFENAGPRPVNQVSRSLRLNQAVGREAVLSELDPLKLGDISFRIMHTLAESKAMHLQNPESGTRLSASSLNGLAPEKNDVQIIVTDGVSAEAVHHNIPDMLPVLEDGLKSRNYRLGRHILVPWGRVKLAESIGDLLMPKLLIVLIGERPGGDALASRSMSAYLVHRISDPEIQKKAAVFSGHDDIRFEYTLFSNIYSGGLPAVEAGSVVAEKAMQILEYEAAGNRLETLLQQVNS